MARVQAKERLPSDEENLTGIPSPDSVTDSPCLKPSLSNGHCNREATTFTFPVESGADQKGVPSVATRNLMSRRTRLERRLIILAVILAACSVTMVTVLFIQWQTGQTSETSALKGSGSNDRICTSPECVTSAAKLISNMDPTVDPCEDFYEYACGGWHRSNVIPEDEARYAIPSELVKNLEIDCKDILERTPPEPEPVAFTKARNFYKSCMDEAALNELGHEPLRALVKELGGWPVVNDGSFDESSWVLEDIMAATRLRLDRNFLFMHRVMQNARNSEKFIAVLDQPKLGLDHRDYFLLDDTLPGLVAYKQFMIDIAVEVRGDGDVDEVTREMNDVLEFEKKMANISLSLIQSREVQMNFITATIAQIKVEYPVIDWNRYFGLVLNTSQVNDSMELCLYSPQYLEGLNRILPETPNRTIANYMMWRSVVYMIDQMSLKVRDIRQSFIKVVSGQRNEPARWKQCADSTNQFMGYAFGSMFIKHRFNKESKATALEMVNHLRISLDNVLIETEWMDDQTKQHALEKAEAIREQIGYDEKLFNYTYLDALYEHIDIKVDRHLNNTIQILSEYTRKTFAKLNQTVDRYAWAFTPVIVNAYYNLGSNTMIFPAGILQPPYFSHTYPRSMNYGGIGVVIGHELTHGFDDRGRLFDKDGNLDLWWSDQSSQSFMENADCLIKQYSNYSYEHLGVNINGYQTLSENIADNGGLKQAFMAYRHSVANGGGEEPPLPGLELTHNQIFFLSFGQLWCGLHRDQDILNAIKNDIHSPFKIRVWGMVSNSEDFAEAFQCPAGSPMNPTRKCGVW